MASAEILAILAAAIAAGAINAVVGSGSLITFPTLLAFGFAPVVANVSNNVGLVPGNVSSVFGYHEELSGQRGRLIRLGIASCAGSLAGACALLEFADVLEQQLLQRARVLVGDHGADLGDEVQQPVGGGHQRVAAADHVGQVGAQRLLAGRRGRGAGRAFGTARVGVAAPGHLVADVGTVHVGRCVAPSAADGPELQLQVGEFAGDVHGKAAGALQLVPQVVRGVHLEIVVARVVGNLARGNEIGRASCRERV